MIHILISHYRERIRSLYCAQIVPERMFVRANCLSEKRELFKRDTVDLTPGAMEVGGGVFSQ